MTNKKIRSHILAFIFLAAGISAEAQDRFSIIQSNLKQLEAITPGLNEKVELSVNGAAIQEFIRGLAAANNINVSVDPNLNFKVVNNFSNVTVAEVFVFLCKQYELDINLLGSIISFTKYVPPVVAQQYVPKQINIIYDKTSNVISFDLKNDTLASVAKELTKATGKNVVFTSDLSNKQVSGYIQNMTFKDAMDKTKSDLNVVIMYASYLEEVKDFRAALSIWQSLLKFDPTNQAYKNKVVALQAKLK